MQTIQGAMVARAAILAIVAGSVVTAATVKLKPTEREIEMLDDRFSPKDAEVFRGDSLIFVNKGKNTHSAVANDKTTFDTGDIKPGQRSQPIKFEKEVTIKYHCSHHKDMKGTLVVKKPQ
jgi:plastocyanin